MAITVKQTTLQKALTINLDSEKYGCFAEIGAGQEVARSFFQAGKASNTVAKTLSAYDMVYSDDIYGKEASGRYVCQTRLKKMLDREFGLLESKLRKSRGSNTCFFALANTVTTKSSPEASRCHGWMGIRFQPRPGVEPCDIIVHVRMLDRYRLQQQEMLGVLGVNLIYAAFYHSHEQKELLPALIDNIKTGRVAIDMIEIAGEGLRHLDPRLLNLELVKRNLTEAILFDPNGNITNLADEVYGKPLFIQRGTYRPVTNTSVDILKFGREHFQNDFSIGKKDGLTLLEITMNQHDSKSGEVDETEFLDRVNSLIPLGHHILVSSFFLFFPLKSFLRKFTRAPMAMTIGAPHLELLFDEKYYEHLEGGLLEGLGALFTGDIKVYVFPYKPDETTCFTSKSFFPVAPKNLLYKYFVDSGKIADIAGCEDVETALPSKEIRRLMEEGNPRWEEMVPPKVVKTIKEQKLFGVNSAPK